MMVHLTTSITYPDLLYLIISCRQDFTKVRISGNGSGCLLEPVDIRQDVGRHLRPFQEEKEFVSDT
jgi:hypothetical protein